MEAIEMDVFDNVRGKDDFEAVSSGNQRDYKRGILIKIPGSQSHSTSQVSDEHIVSSGRSSCRSYTGGSELGFLNVDDTVISNAQRIPAEPLCRKFWRAGNYDDGLGSKVSSQCNSI